MHDLLHVHNCLQQWKLKLRLFKIYLNNLRPFSNVEGDEEPFLTTIVTLDVVTFFLLWNF
jgi:hypothetical protein